MAQSFNVRRFLLMRYGLPTIDNGTVAVVDGEEFTLATASIQKKKLFQQKVV